MKNKKIAIVGGGACGVGSLHHLSKIISSNTLKYKDIQIDLYDPKQNGGVAYSTDIESHILNMNLSTMTIEPNDPHHFNGFIQSTPEVLMVYNQYLNNHNDGNPPRKLIRQYLDYVVGKVVDLAVLHPSFNISFFEKEVKNIVKGSKGYLIHTSEGVTSYDYVVLAIGNLEPKDFYKNLIGDERYFTNPWPFDRLINETREAFDKEETSIGVLGSSLTAIDIAVGFKEKGYQGKISFFSRSGLLPSVQASQPSFYSSKIKNLVDSNEYKSIAIADVIEKIRTELEEVKGEKLDFKSMFEKRYARSAAENLEQDIRGANVNGYKYQDYFFNISKYLPAIWERVELEEKLWFLGNHMSLWSVYRSAMPMQNAKRIQDLLQSGILQIHQIAKEAKAITLTDQHITIKNRNQKVIACDFIINATGTSLDTKSSKNKLIKKLIQNDLVDHHPAGGLQINSKSLEVINRNGQISENLFLIGSLTRGNLFYTNAYEANINQAKQLSKIISKSIITKI